MSSIEYFTLNLFIEYCAGHKGSLPVEQPSDPENPDSGVLDVDSSSTKSGRRPSVDTVSTYLSHDSELRTSRVSTKYLFHMVSLV